MKTIKIENKEYSYLISKIDKEEGISIELKEIKPDKNIIFKYEALLNKIIVEKREEKYIMIIEVQTFGKMKNYEIELKKIVQIDDKKVLLSRIENIESKFELIQQEINN